jgi:hypothetical protein
MDASEIIKKLQSQAQYRFFKEKLAVTAPTVNISTCGAIIPASTGETLNFPSYVEKQLLFKGKLYCSSCTNSCNC